MTRTTHDANGEGPIAGFRLLAAALIVLNTVIIAVYSAYYFDMNDNMYAAAPLAQGVLYRDIQFVQGPGTFYFLKAISFIAPAGFHFLALRLSSMMLLLGAMLVGAFMCIDYWRARCLFLALAGANLYFIRPSLEIGSYSLPLFLLSLATASILRFQDRRLAIGSAALLIGLSASSKLNHVLFFLPLVVLVLLEKRENQSFVDWARAAVLPFIAGSFTGSLPVIIAFVRDPKPFLLETLIFHSEFSLKTLDYSSADLFKIFFHEFYGWAAAGGAVLAALGAYAAFIQPNSDEKSRRSLQFIVLSFIVALFAASAPRIVYIQYLAPVAFFATLAAAKFFDREPQAKLGLMGALAVLAVCPVGLGAIQVGLLANIRDAGGAPKIATVMDVNRKLKAYALRMDDTRQCDSRIFSLAGAFVADSGFPLSRYMESGSFWSWVRAHAPRTYIDDKSYRLDEYMLYPERWVRDQHINFLLLGYYEGPIESEMEKYAIEAGFDSEVIRAWNGLTLKFFFNPNCIKSI